MCNHQQLEPHWKTVCCICANTLFFWRTWRTTQSRLMSTLWNAFSRDVSQGWFSFLTQLLTVPFSGGRWREQSAVVPFSGTLCIIFSQSTTSCLLPLTSTKELPLWSSFWSSACQFQPHLIHNHQLPSFLYIYGVSSGHVQTVTPCSLWLYLQNKQHVHCTFSVFIPAPIHPGHYQRGGRSTLKLCPLDLIGVPSLIPSRLIKTSWLIYWCSWTHRQCLYKGSLFFQSWFNFKPVATQIRGDHSSIVTWLLLQFSLFCL